MSCYWGEKEGRAQEVALSGDMLERFLMIAISLARHSLGHSIAWFQSLRMGLV